MAANYNRVILAGNLTRDPQVRFFSNERAVADFGLAVNRRYKTADGESKDEVTFVDIECWGRTAELVGQYLTKGRSALIEGRLKLDSWEDKEGNRRSKLRVVADTVQFLDSRGGAPGAGGEAEGGERPARSGARRSEPLSDGPGPQASDAPAPEPSADEPPF